MNDAIVTPVSVPVSLRRRALVWLLFAAILGLAPWCFPSDAALTLMTQMGTAAILALSFNLLLGSTGLLSFCHATYAGIGAYAGVWCMNRIGVQGLPVSMAIVPLAGAVAAGIAGATLGYVTTRRSGMTFAMITLGVAELVWVMAAMLPEWFGGERGIPTDRTMGAAWFGVTFATQREVYALVAVWLFVCAGLMYGVTRTPLGFLARAVRDNAGRVAFLGQSPAAVRYRMQIIAAAFAGVAGALGALNFELVSADTFSLERSGIVLVFTVLGGTAYFAGPILGAVVGVFATVVLASLTRAWQLYLGLGFLAVVIFAPGGMSGLIAAHVHAWRDGRVRVLWKPYAAVCLGFVLSVGGLIGVVEMTYGARLASDAGLNLAGRPGAHAATAVWGAAAAMVVVGVATLTFAGRRLRHTVASARLRAEVQR
ncbi:branched-chain amino acid ABC transporter permease [Pandoraea apista]|uniref:branched-chain amino acid ABC transporter permease n=1 Tax=Pandoraea apista TaxID=93218 RepID=UPI00058AA141|nr:branched-chain amino acid ABC transporter permease [Pandoraea apista]AJF00122.1 ABC transporter permease [Pandoraea apista]AKH74277.1 ABC transporter permease [Pandoraea apista]AKI62826.1 ABC transporter permease [Pandoraea apista]